MGLLRQTKRPHPILLVEDNMEDVFQMRRVFEKAGVTHPLMAVASKRQALDYFQGKGEYEDAKLFSTPSLMLLDLKLPDGSGFEILEWVRASQTFATLPVVVLTACFETPEIAQAYRMGANSYMLKPASARQVEQIIKFFVEAMSRQKLVAAR